MSTDAVIHSTFVIERTYPQSTERVFSAFSDPTQARRWFAESEGHEVETFTMDPRVGGTSELRYRFKEGSPFAGVVVVNESTYLDVKPNQRIVTASRMTLGDQCISASLVTVEMLPTSEAGTDLICTYQGAFFEGSDGPQMREMGWRTLLDRLHSVLMS